MKSLTFGFGMLAGVFVVVACLFGYFRLGIAPVATAERPMLFEHTLAKAALHARIRREMPTVVPISYDEGSATTAAEIYKNNCAVCHGLPGQASTPVANGMFPKPPQLFVKMVTDDPPGEIYWKTKNGIRLTGMPAFGKSLTETELWQVSLLLKNADKVPQGAKKLLNGGNTCGNVATPTNKIAMSQR